MLNDEAALFDDMDIAPAIETVGSETGRFDPDVERVAAWFLAQPRLEERFSGVFRQSIDEVLDGQRTGRYDLRGLEKTEKTYLGTKVEIVCRAEFGLGRGDRMDYRVAGVDVDAKFTLRSGWMVPKEAMGHICLVMAADDLRSTFRVGLVRIREEILTGGGNRDGKRGISSAGRTGIKWLVENGKLAGNLLLGLDPVTRDRIMAEPPGQNRVDQLFRSRAVHGCVVDRNAAATVAKQLDPAKRVRDARHRLAREGVVILGHQNDSKRIAQALGLPVPQKGTWVPARLVPASEGTSRPRVLIEGRWWMVARAEEEPHPAPKVNC